MILNVLHFIFCGPRLENTCLHGLQIGYVQETTVNFYIPHPPDQTFELVIMHNTAKVYFIGPENNFDK